MAQAPVYMDVKESLFGKGLKLSEVCLVRIEGNKKLPCLVVSEYRVQLLDKPNSSRKHRRAVLTAARTAQRRLKIIGADKPNANN